MWAVRSNNSSTRPTLTLSQACCARFMCAAYNNLRLACSCRTARSRCLNVKNDKPETRITRSSNSRRRLGGVAQLQPAENHPESAPLPERRGGLQVTLPSLALKNIEKKWTMPLRNWKQALQQFVIDASGSNMAVWFLRGPDRVLRPLNVLTTSIGCQ